MKITIIGAGGVGGLFGAHLVRGGADVIFIARGVHLAALQADGIRIEGVPGGDVHVPKVAATDDPATVGPVDLVMVAVKLGATEAALAAARPLVGPDTALVSFQNGVLKDDMLRAAFDPARIFGGVAYVGSAIDRPGVIRQTGPMQRLVFGEFDGSRSARVAAFLAACQAGGINAEIAPDIRRAIWEKFVFLVGLSGTTATMRVPIGPIRTNPQTRAFLLDVMREVVAVGRAHGVDLPADYAEIRLELADDVSPAMTSSLHHDLQRGNALEAPWLAGGVVDLGRQVNVPTPLNRAIADILALYVAGTPAEANGP
jgi:2-dehydropantoate 2-reductase